MSDFILNNDLKIGTIFETYGTTIKVTLEKNLVELVQTHGGTVYSVGQVGSIVKIHMGRNIIFAMVRMLRLQTEEEAASEGTTDVSDRRVLEADLLGEAKWQNDKQKLIFQRGSKTPPLPLQAVYILTSTEAAKLFFAIEEQHQQEGKKHIDIGQYSGATSVPCRANIDKMFGHHFAVLGSTGSGKSTAVAVVLHAILSTLSEGQDDKIFPRIIIIDPHGEYSSAFSADAVTYQAYDDGNIQGSSRELVRLPYWLMSSDEFRRLVVGKGEFEATSQANVVYKALSHARMHAAGLVLAAMDQRRKEDPERHPDLPFVADGIDEQEIAEFNRDWPLPFDLDEFCNHIIHCQNNRIQKKEWVPQTDTYFQEKFASILDKLSVLRRDKRIRFLMENHNEQSPDLSQILSQFVGRESEDNHSLRILDISGLPNEVAGPLTASLSRLLFNYKLYQFREEREQDPILLVCEEAHRYVPDRGEAQYSSAQDAVRRIAREGRKYGIGLMLVSQRPSDIESTVLSQCNSWLVLRLTNRRDQEHVSRYLPDSLSGLSALLPSLPRRHALFIGEAAAIPAQVRLKFLRESDRPKSNDISFSDGWRNEFPCADELKSVAQRMVQT